MKKIAIYNNKGGVGKSTIAANLAHGLSELDFKVLLIDLDGQRDSPFFLGFNDKDFDKTFYDLLDNHNPIKVKDCIFETRDNLDLIPSNNMDKIKSEFHREPRIDMVLDDLLKDVEGMSYDYVIIDCSPKRNKVNNAILFYVDDIIMPIQTEIASVKNIGNVYDYLTELRIPKNKVSVVIPNMHDKRTNSSKEKLKMIQDFFEGETETVTPPINRRVAITEAGELGKSVFEYDKTGADQFYDVLEMVVKTIGY